MGEAHGAAILSRLYPVLEPGDEGSHPGKRPPCSPACCMIEAPAPCSPAGEGTNRSQWSRGPEGGWRYKGAQFEGPLAI